jgi:hypothetical protein
MSAELLPCPQCKAGTTEIRFKHLYHGFYGGGVWAVECRECGHIVPVASRGYDEQAFIEAWNRSAQSGITPPNTEGQAKLKESPLSDVRATVGDQDKINVLYAMVEGLHAMIYGTYTINSGDFALKALGDGGSIHEYVHAMMLLLPERCYEQIQSGGEVAADKGEASRTDLEKWRKDHLPEQVADEAMAKAIADGTEGELIASRVLSQSNGSDK